MKKCVRVFASVLVLSLSTGPDSFASTREKHSAFSRVFQEAAVPPAACAAFHVGPDSIDVAQGATTELGFVPPSLNLLDLSPQSDIVEFIDISLHERFTTGQVKKFHVVVLGQEAEGTASRIRQVIDSTLRQHHRALQKGREAFTVAADVPGADGLPFEDNVDAWVNQWDIQVNAFPKAYESNTLDSNLVKSQSDLTVSLNAFAEVPSERLRCQFIEQICELRDPDNRHLLVFKEGTDPTIPPLLLKITVNGAWRLKKSGNILWGRFRDELVGSAFLSQPNSLEIIRLFGLMPSDKLDAPLARIESQGSEAQQQAAAWARSRIHKDFPTKSFGPDKLKDPLDYAKISAGFIPAYDGFLDFKQQRSRWFSAANTKGKDARGLGWANLLNMSWNALQDAVSHDPQLSAYVSALMTRPDNQKTLRIRVSSRLPVNAARYFNPETGTAEIIFSEPFVQELTNRSRYFPEAVRLVVAERLFHELGHSNADQSYEELLKEEGQLILQDLALNSVWRPADRDRIDTLFRQRNPTIGSKHYFYFLKELRAASADKRPGMIKDFLTANYPKKIGKSPVKPMPSVPPTFPDGRSRSLTALVKALEASDWNKAAGLLKRIFKEPLGTPQVRSLLGTIPLPEDKSLLPGRLALIVDRFDENVIYFLVRIVSLVSDDLVRVSRIGYWLMSATVQNSVFTYQDDRETDVSLSREGENISWFNLLPRLVKQVTVLHPEPKVRRTAIDHTKMRQDLLKLPHRLFSITPDESYDAYAHLKTMPQKAALSTDEHRWVVELPYDDGKTLQLDYGRISRTFRITIGLQKFYLPKTKNPYLQVFVEPGTEKLTLFIDEEMFEIMSERRIVMKGQFNGFEWEILPQDNKPKNLLTFDPLRRPSPKSSDRSGRTLKPWIRFPTSDPDGDPAAKRAANGPKYIGRSA